MHAHASISVDMYRAHKVPIKPNRRGQQAIVATRLHGACGAPMCTVSTSARRGTTGMGRAMSSMMKRFSARSRAGVAVPRHPPYGMNFAEKVRRAGQTRRTLDTQQGSMGSCRINNGSVLPKTIIMSPGG